MENTNDKTASKTASIQRYGVGAFSGHWMSLPGGDYVKYADHVAALEVRAEEARREAAADYEEVLAGHRRLVRELDVLLNGEAGAAKQASLCDIVSQVKREGIRIADAQRTAGGDAVPPAKRLGDNSLEYVNGWNECRAATLTQPVAEAAAQADDCPKCKGTGEQDSGGVTPWGEGINIPCDCASPTAQPTPEQQAEINVALDRADAEDAARFPAAQPTPPDDERAAFEKWYRANHLTNSMSRKADGQYQSDRQHDYWTVWQAALRQPGAPADSLAQLRTLIANDGHAGTFQSMAQYRTALLKAADAIRKGSAC